MSSRQPKATYAKRPGLKEHLPPQKKKEGKKERENYFEGTNIAIEAKSWLCLQYKRMSQVDSALSLIVLKGKKNLACLKNRKD